MRLFPYRTSLAKQPQASTVHPLRVTIREEQLTKLRTQLFVTIPFGGRSENGNPILGNLYITFDKMLESWAVVRIHKFSELAKLIALVPTKNEIIVEGFFLGLRKNKQYSLQAGGKYQPTVNVTGSFDIEPNFKGCGNKYRADLFRQVRGQLIQLDLVKKPIKTADAMTPDFTVKKTKPKLSLFSGGEAAEVVRPETKRFYRREARLAKAIEHRVTAVHVLEDAALYASFIARPGLVYVTYSKSLQNWLAVRVGRDGLRAKCLGVVVPVESVVYGFQLGGTQPAKANKRFRLQPSGKVEETEDNDRISFEACSKQSWGYSKELFKLISDSSEAKPFPSSSYNLFANNDLAANPKDYTQAMYWADTETGIAEVWLLGISSRKSSEAEAIVILKSDLENLKKSLVRPGINATHPVSKIPLRLLLTEKQANSFARFFYSIEPWAQKLSNSIPESYYFGRMGNIASQKNGNLSVNLRIQPTDRRFIKLLKPLDFEASGKVRLIVRTKYVLERLWSCCRKAAKKAWEY